MILSNPLENLKNIMSLNSDDEYEIQKFNLAPKIQGPRSILMEILRRDPKNAEMLRKIKMESGGAQDDFE